MQSQNSTKKERDRIGMILYYLYAAFLVLSVVLVGRIAWIQWAWKPAKEVVKYFRPVSERSVIYPERGAIIGNDGKLLAISTPMYELFMDCTVRKDYFESKGKDGKRMEAEWQSKAKEFAKGLSAEMGADGENYWKMIEKGRRDGAKYLRLGHAVDRETLLRIQKLPLVNEGQYRSGVIVRKKDTRQYPYGTLARRTIGYVKDNSNSNGNNHIGIEGKYDYVLHGKEGEIWLRLEIIEGVYGYAHANLFTLAEGYTPLKESEAKSAATEEKETVSYVTPTVNVLDIYAGESDTEEIVATVEYGTVLELIEQGEKWSHVKTLDGVEGYVAAKDIETTDYDPDSAMVEVVNKFVNLRAEASTDSEKLGSLNQGETAQYLGEEDGFYKVRLEDGTEGYVSKDYTRLAEGGETATDTEE